MPARSASERSLVASIAANTSWSRTTDRAARTSPARSALWQKFLDQADGDAVRAEHAWRAHFARLALRSAQARRRRRELDAFEAETAAMEHGVDGGEVA